MPRFLASLIGRFERSLGTELDYMREMARVAPGSLLRLIPHALAGMPRRGVPREAAHLAALGATLAQDCGSCVQIAVTMARRDGVAAPLLRAALQAPATLEPALADALSFGGLAARPDAPGEELDPLRERLRDRWGDRGLVDLSLAVAGAQGFPVLKRALGFARSCRLVEVEVDG